MARRYPQDICDKMFMNTRVTDSDPNIVARFYRPYNGKSHDYTDPYIREYVQTISGDDYDDYGVVPKTIDMSLLAISRYFRNPHPYDEHFTQLYESAALFLDLEFKDCIGSKKISFDEALSDLDGTKSPGWPWTLMYNTKNDLWGSPHVSFFDEYWQSLATDDPVKVFCSASVKEELRQKLKIKMKNCRTVVCMDAFHLAASCMMYSDYSSRFKKAKLTNCSALGQSFLQGGAQKIVDYIDVFGPATCFSADARQYDSRFTGFVFRLITQHFKRSIFELTKDDLKRLENLTSDLYNAPIVGLDGHVYYRETGSVSGHLMTTINNIQKNFLDWFVMWLELAPTHLKTYSAFKELVRLLFVGDDIIGSAHPSTHSFFNIPNILAVSKKLDMEYTFDQTDGKFCDIEGTTFCSQRFVKTTLPKYGSMYLPVLDQRRMEASAYHYNTEGTLSHSVIRACGLRVATFADPSTRKFFSDALISLRRQAVHRNDAAAIRELSANLTDTQLWNLYTGYEFDFMAAPQQMIRPLIHTPHVETVCATLHSSEHSNSPTRIISAHVSETILLPRIQVYTMPNSKNRRRSNMAAAGAVTPARGVRLRKPRGRVGSRRTTGNHTASQSSVLVAGPARTKSSKPSALRTGLRGIASAIHPIGGHIFDAAAGAWDKIFGSGKYNIRYNSLWTRGGPGIGPKPEFSQGSEPGSIRVRWHDVCVNADILSANYPNFQVQNQYYLNPLNSSTHPWLRAIALDYLEYRYHGIIWYYESTSGDAVSSTDSALGQVIGATDYNVADSNFSTRAQMLETFACEDDKPSKNFYHPVECAADDGPVKWRFNTTSSTLSGVTGDPRLYFLGSTQWATVGQQASFIVGNVRIIFDVEFRKPSTVTIATNAMSFGIPSTNGSVIMDSVGGYLANGQAFGNPYSLNTSSKVVTFSNANALSQGGNAWPIGNYNLSVYSKIACLNGSSGSYSLNTFTQEVLPAASSGFAYPSDYFQGSVSGSTPVTNQSYGNAQQSSGVQCTNGSLVAAAHYHPLLDLPLTYSTPSSGYDYWYTANYFVSWDPRAHPLFVLDLPIYNSSLTGPTRIIQTAMFTLAYAGPGTNQYSGSYGVTDIIPKGPPRSVSTPQIELLADPEPDDSKDEEQPDDLTQIKMQLSILNQKLSSYKH